MSSHDLAFWSWLLFPSSKLVEIGVDARDVVRCRFEATGHVRRAPVVWAEAFFSWGSVESADEIALKTGHTAEQVRQYARDAGLRTATRTRRRTHAELAIALWCDRARTPRESCVHFGVPPGARRILCSAAQELVDTAEGGVKEVLGWQVTQLEQRFAALRLDLQPPRHVLAAVRGGVCNQRRAA